MSKSFAIDYWLRYNTPTNIKLIKCIFTDTLNGWACGDSGTIIHSSDGGINWVLQDTPIDYYMEDIFFVNSNTGWALANEFFFAGTTILSTTNGGANWDSTRFFDTTVVLSSVYFTDPMNGWMGSYYGKIYKTTNGGMNWTYSPSDSGTFAGFKIARFRFFSNGYGFACGGQIDIAGVVWKTDNNGSLWTSQAVSPEPLFDIVYFDSLNALGVGGDYEYGTFIVKTSNGGLNWDYESLEMFGQGQKLCFRTSSDVWIPLGFSHTWAVSFNGGTNWMELPVEQDLAVWDAQFVTPLHGWAVCDSGVVLKFNPASVGINNSNTEIPASLTLYQNYPNPFNPSTTIEYELVKTGLVELIIYDITGKQIESISFGKQSPGSYKYKFIGDRYPSGVYYYKLSATGEAGDFSETKKMVLIK